jgi:hypothetical protein
MYITPILPQQASAWLMVMPCLLDVAIHRNHVMDYGSVFDIGNFVIQPLRLRGHEGTIYTLVFHAVKRTLELAQNLACRCRGDSARCYDSGVLQSGIQNRCPVGR